jgi:hypothetical protein
MPNEINDIFKTCKTIAVVGLSSDESRPSRYLQGCGFKVIPINPTLKEALGEKAYASLREVPEKIDIVDVFRRAEDVPPIADDAIAVGAKCLWMQEGIVNKQAAKKAEAAGLKVVMDRCIMMEHLHNKED